MKQKYSWLLVALLLALLVPSALLAEGTGLSSSIEVGAAGISVDDEVNKVNEYSTVGDDEGANPYLKFNYLGDYEASHVDLGGAIMSSDDIDLNLDLDLRRVFRLDGSYSEFNHWLSHDQLDYMDATMKSQGQTYANGDGPVAGGSANPSVLAQDLVPNKDFFIIHKEVDLEGKVIVPSLPSVTLKAGFRQEERDGVEQEFSMSHCSSCHIEGNAKEIDETTTDLSVGATGKFGMLTVDYEFMTRDFDDQSEALTNVYLLGAKPQQDLPAADFQSGRMLFDESNGEVPFSKTPDSEKDTHSLKARYDLSGDTVLSAGYIKADIESSKQDDVGVTLATNTLETEYDAYNMRASSRFDNLRLTAYGRREEIDASSNTLTFTYANGAEVPALEDRASYESEEAREITTFGGNAIYRISSGTSVRLGYEFEEVDRELEEMMDTETHTVKASLRFRPTSKLNGRVSYTYQDIKDQFMHPHGNKGPIAAFGPNGEPITYDGTKLVYTEAGTGNIIDINAPGKDWYEPAFYSQRSAEASSLPENVHELKASTTWAPSASYSVTFYARYRTEENELNFNTYQQDSFSPGTNVWWAPINNLNMTMAYNFNKLKTENQMCVGWYHG